MFYINKTFTLSHYSQVDSVRVQCVMCYLLMSDVRTEPRAT